MLISAASGAVGQIAGQIARIKGFDPVAVAGSDVKVEWCKGIGYRTGINHRTAGDLAEAIARACPSGVDVCMGCCRFRGHEDKIVTKKLECRYDETAVQP